VDNRKRTALDVAYGVGVKQMIRACETEIVSRMNRAKHLRLAADASTRARGAGATSGLSALKRTPAGRDAKSRRTHKVAADA
jgi:hypothetical protein